MPRSEPPPPLPRTVQPIRVAPAPACSRPSPLRVRSRKAVERCGRKMRWKGAMERRRKGSENVRQKRRHAAAALSSRRSSLLLPGVAAAGAARGPCA